jgi:hypothetical protein
MNNTATVHDFPLTQFRRQHARHSMQADARPEAAPGIFTHMADGIFVLDCALTFAGFGEDARKLVLNIIGRLGDRQDALQMYDESLAEHLKVSVRTVRRWRSAYLSEMERQNFGFIEITGGDYDQAEKKNQPFKYRIICKDYVEMAVNEGQQSEAYARDRDGALQKAAEANYDELPEAPVRQDRKKPKRSLATIERPFELAAQRLSEGIAQVEKMEPARRAAFFNTPQGRQLRELQRQLLDQLIQSADPDLLLEVQDKIESKLQGSQQAAGNREVKTPPVNLTAPPAAAPPPADSEFSDRAYLDSEIELSPEELAERDAIWERTFGRLNEPKVRKVELELEPEPPDVPPATFPIGDDLTTAHQEELGARAAIISRDELEELEEQAAVLEYVGGLPRAEAERRALELYQPARPRRNV